MKRFFSKLLLPLLVLALGAAGTLALVRSRPEVETVVPEAAAPLVRVVTVRQEDVPLTVTAQGTVLPRTETTLVARVAGQILRVSPKFEAGAFFSEGEVLLALDTRDFELAVDGAQAQVAQAEVALAREEAEAELALQEWQELGQGEAPALVRREPQLAEARAMLAASQAALERARLDLERTQIRAPFTGRLRSKAVDLGQYVTPGQPLASIHAIDYAEVRLPVPDDELAYIELPHAYRNAGERASHPEVTLWARFAGRRHRWQGRIVRTEGELDPQTRMLHLVARVEDPYDRSADGRPPMAVGLFVEAEISGHLAEGVVRLPRAALREGGQVLVVEAGERLRFRAVEVLRMTESEALIRSGLEDGEWVCVSPLEVVVDGMRVRIETEGS